MKAQIQYVLQMTKLAIIPFTVLLETIFLKKRFRLVRKTSLGLVWLEENWRDPRNRKSLAIQN